MSNIIVRILASILWRLGYEIKQKGEKKSIDKDYLLDNFFTTLQNERFNPTHIVDIGANHGTWTRKALGFFPDARYTLIEPQIALKSSIQDLLDINDKVKFYPVGAGAKEGSFMFTIHDRDDSCTFGYSEEEAKRLGLKQVEIPVLPLNTLITNEKLSIPEMIKIDAEGIDLEVLDGCSDFFGKTEIFLIEASVVSKGFENTLQNVIVYMDQKGYAPFEITDLNRPFEKQVLWLVEMVFVRKGGFLHSLDYTK